MITREDLLNKLINGAVWNTGVTFERTNPVPIEKYSIFESLATAQEYAQNNPVAYPGQTLAVITEEGAVTLYIITADKSAPEKALQEVGSKTLGDDASISLAADGTLSLYGFKEAVDGYLPQKSNGKIKWIAISEIVKGDGNTVTNGDTKSIDTAGDDKELTATLHGFDAASTNYIPYKDADGTLKWKAEYSYDDAVLAGRVDALETADSEQDKKIAALEDKFTGEDAKNALSLGGHAAADYQLAAELKALAKKDEVAEGDLEKTLATKINGKAEQSALTALDTRVAGVEDNFNEAGAALDAVKLGNKAASDYVLKTDKVAEDNLATELATKVNGKADKTYVDEQLDLKATVAAQNATEEKAEQNKKDITRVEKEYKAADTALDDRLKDAENSLKGLSNVMEFKGAFDTLPDVSGYNNGDVVVIKAPVVSKKRGADNKDAGKEFVCVEENGVKEWVEFGNSNASQAAIADLQKNDKAQDGLISGLRADVDLKATKEEVNTLSGVVAKKAEQSALETATGRITAVEGEVDTLNAKPAFGITSDQISNWDKEVGAKAQADTNKQGLADLKAVVDHETTGLAATKAIADQNKLDIATNADAIAVEKGAKAIADANKLAIENEVTGLAATKKIADDAAQAAGAEKGALAKATANEEALKTKVEQETFDTLNDTVTNSSTGLVKKVGDLETSVEKKAAQSDLEALQNKVNAKNTGLDSKASKEDLALVKTTAEAAQTEAEVKALIGAAEIAQSQVTGLDTALSGKENVGVAAGLVNALTGEITGTPAADSTITALAQANGKVTATVGKIQIAETQVTGLADKLSGLRTDVDTKQTAAQVNELIQAASINVNKLIQSENEYLILDGGNAGMPPSVQKNGEN